MNIFSKILDSVFNKKPSDIPYTDPNLFAQKTTPSAKETPPLAPAPTDAAPFLNLNLPNQPVLVPVTEIIDVIPPDPPELEQELIVKSIGKNTTESTEYVVDSHVFKELSKSKAKKNEISQRGVDPIYIPSLLELLVPYQQVIEQSLQNEQYDLSDQYFQTYMLLNPNDIEMKIKYTWFLIEQMSQIDRAWQFFHELFSQYQNDLSMMKVAYSFYSTLQAYEQLYYLLDLLAVNDLTYQNEWLIQKRQLLSELIENPSIQQNQPDFYQKLQQDHFHLERDQS
jgi:hypothetical protein